MTTTIIRIIHIVLGVFFIFSSVSKAIEIDSFAYILMSYGHKNLQFLGPLITASEFFIGLSLLLNFYVKKVTTFSLWLISIFTGLYIYGFIFLNITDCGCFGSTIKVAPIYSILKNIFLIFLLFYLSLSKYKNSYPANWKTVICSFLPLIVL